MFFYPINIIKTVQPIEKIKQYFSDALDIFPVAGIITIILLILLKLFFNLMKYKRRSELKEKIAELDALLNEGMVKQAADIASELFEESKSNQDRWLYSYLKNDEGIYYYKLSQLYNRYGNLKKSKQSFEDAKKAFQKKWLHIFTFNKAIYVQILMNLANVFIEFSKIRNSKANLFIALDYLNQAVRYKSLKKYPELYISQYINLVKVNCLLFELENNQLYLKKALEWSSLARKFEKIIQNESLCELLFWEAKVYENLNLANLEEKSDSSLSCYIEALNLIDSKNSPEIFIDLLYYSSQYSLKHLKMYEKNIHEIIIDFDNLKNIYPSESYQEKHADLSIYSGKAFLCLNKIQFNKEYFRLSFDSFNKSTKIYHLDSYPIDFAYIQYYMAELLFISLKENKIHLQTKILEVVHYYKNALKLFTIEKYPIQHAKILYKLAIIYEFNAQFDNENTNLQLSLDYYNQTIRTFNAEQYPRSFTFIEDGKEITAQIH